MSLYAVGWICALPHELAASRAMLDIEHRPLEQQHPQDHNVYTLGSIAGHNIVMACLPASSYGLASAATVAKDMLRTFISVRFGLMVGIGGGAPLGPNDIRLGDVVVSNSFAESGGVIQYDVGKILQGGRFERRGVLDKPPELLRNAVNHLRASHEMEDSQISRHVSDMLEA